MKFFNYLVLLTIIFTSIAAAQDYSSDLKNIQDSLNAKDQQLQSKASKNKSPEAKSLMQQIMKRIDIVRDTMNKVNAKARDCAKSKDSKIQKECQASIINKINEMKAELAKIDTEIKNLK